MTLRDIDACSVCHVLLLLLVSVVAECMYHESCYGPNLLLSFDSVAVTPGPEGFVVRNDVSHGD